MEAELYFVAFYKHGTPQFIVAGPYVSFDTAREEADRQGPQRIVVKTTLRFEVCS